MKCDCMFCANAVYDSAPSDSFGFMSVNYLSSCKCDEELMIQQCDPEYEGDCPCYKEKEGEE